MFLLSTTEIRDKQPDYDLGKNHGGSADQKREKYDVQGWPFSRGRRGEEGKSLAHQRSQFRVGKTGATDFCRRREKKGGEKKAICTADRVGKKKG